jgi:hypothetical protein
MRVLITGSRTWSDHQPIHDALDEILRDHPDMVLVSGACSWGADAIAERWATLRGATVERHPAEWRKHGRGAGFKRNSEMVTAGAEVCLAFIADASRGATHCANQAEKAGIPVKRWTS